MKNIAKILCFVFSLVFVLSTFGIGTFAQEVTGLSGEGTVESPYLINNVQELMWFRDDVNAGNDYAGQYVQLNADIDLTLLDWSVNIGDDANATFDGIFDGANHTIKNLKSTEKAQKGDGYVCAGLFGAIAGNAVIKNLTIENAKITVGEYSGDCVGVVVGFVYKANTTFENIKVTGTVKIDAPNVSSVGAIFGYQYLGTVAIDNCVVDVNDGSYINAVAQAGGIAGYTSDKFVANDCVVENLTIKGKCLIGGVAGLLFGSAKVTDCTVNNVDVYATKTDLWSSSSAIVAGGLVNSGTTITGLAYDNVTENGVVTNDVVGSVYAFQPTEKVPAISASINDVYYVTLQEAIDAAQNGDVIVINNNVIVNIDPTTFTVGHGDDDAAFIIPADKQITIDLNGYTVSVVATLPDGADHKHSGAIINKGDLTIEDSSAAATGKLVFEYVGAYDNGYKRHGAIMNLGTLTVNGGTIENATALENQPAIDNTNYNKTNVTVVINGGVVKSAGYFAIDMVGYYDFAPALINSVTINDGVIDGGIYARVQANTKLDLAINGGTIKSDFSYAVYYRVYYTGCEYSASITGGTFITAEGTDNIYVRLASGAELAGFINGGSFTTDVTEYCVPGFMLIPNESGSFGVASISAAPYIGENGNWWIGDVDTGMMAYPNVEPKYCEKHGVMCWFVTSGNGTVECVGQAIGLPGTVPTIAIVDGYWYIDNKDGKGLLPTGVKAIGTDGLTITSIYKDATQGDELVSVYVVTFSNGYTWSFTVTNGVDGVQGFEGAQGIQGAKGEKGDRGLEGADGNDNNQAVIIVIAIATVCLVFTLAVVLYRGVDRRSWWCTR